jgi:threonine aldolase
LARNLLTDLPEIAQLCDAFYIGGTKNGILFGEALVICNDKKLVLKRNLIF